MASGTILLQESPRGSEVSERTRRHSPTGTTWQWRDCGLHVQGYWATTVSSQASAPYSDVSLQITPASPVEECRRGRLATKSITGLHSVFAAIRGKSNEPPSGRQRRRHWHSTTSIDTASPEASCSPRSSLQAPHQSSPCNPVVRPDLSALVPDCLDDPPPYSSPVREHQEAIDWNAHFDRTPILTKTLSPHSPPTRQDTLSPGASGGGAWDRVARRLSR